MLLPFWDEYLEKNQERNNGNSCTKNHHYNHGGEDLWRGGGIASQGADRSITGGCDDEAWSENGKNKNEHHPRLIVHLSGFLYDYGDCIQAYLGHTALYGKWTPVQYHRAPCEAR